MARRKAKKKMKFRFGKPQFLLLLAAILVFTAFRNTDYLQHLGDKILSFLPAPDAGFSEKPKLVFVIDDIGYHLEHEKLMASLGDDVVYAILPLLPYSKHFGNLSKKTGADVILHLPLETQDGTIPGRGLITRQMDPARVREMLASNLKSVPNHIGANNHMGSLGTSDPALMRVILGEFKKKKLLFLDSYTSNDSVISSVGREIGMNVLVRDVFLDNVDAKPAIREQIRKLKAAARSKGYAIGIGHYRHNTLSVLKEDIPEMRKEGFEILTLKQMSRFIKSKKKKS